MSILQKRYLRHRKINLSKVIQWSSRNWNPELAPELGLLAITVPTVFEVLL